MTAARPWLRRAGHGTAPDGSVVTWSMAEGRRGSRWREVRAHDGGVLSSLLLELDPEGRFSHLELSTPAGLLTLHPEADGTLHGNAVDATGVRHVVALPWSPHDAVILAGSPIAWAASARLRQATESVSLVIVGPDLSLSRDTIARTVGRDRLDPDGLPMLADGATWPLEVDD